MILRFSPLCSFPSEFSLDYKKFSENSIPAPEQKKTKTNKQKVHVWINLAAWGRKGLWQPSVWILHVYGSVVSEPVSILDNDVPWFTHSIFSCHLTFLSFSVLQPLTCISSCFSFVVTKTSSLLTWSSALICNTFSVLHVSFSFYFSRMLPLIHLSFHTSSPFGR